MKLKTAAFIIAFPITLPWLAIQYSKQKCDKLQGASNVGRSFLKRALILTGGGCGVFFAGLYAALGGAALGTLICPGAGTVIGLLLGVAWGALVGAGVGSLLGVVAGKVIPKAWARTNYFLTQHLGGYKNRLPPVSPSNPSKYSLSSECKMMVPEHPQNDATYEYKYKASGREYPAKDLWKIAYILHRAKKENMKELHLRARISRKYASLADRAVLSRNDKFNQALKDLRTLELSMKEDRTDNEADQTFYTFSVGGTFFKVHCAKPRDTVENMRSDCETELDPILKKSS